MGDTRRLPVPDGLDGMRVDAGLARLLGLSRTVVATLAEDGRVAVDGHPAGKSDRLVAGSWLEVDLPQPEAPAALAAPVEVVAGLTGAAERQGIVHRLDVGTTGVMVVAASERAYTTLKRAFKERAVTKRYRALAQGHPDPSRGTIDAPIDRHPRHDYKFAVVAGGRPSITHYDTLEAFRSATLLDVRLETGRTHQIRVHLAALRHPLVGDVTYGADPVLARRLDLGRQWLHAHTLGFAHPADGRWVEFTCPHPPDLERALDLLRE